MGSNGIINQVFKVLFLQNQFALSDNQEVGLGILLILVNFTRMQLRVVLQSGYLICLIFGEK